jgi:hypothetical protein
MDRRHLIIPAALLAGSALLGGRALIGTMSNDSPAADRAASSTLTSAMSEQALADRAAQLDAMSRRIDAIDADTPPIVTPAAASQLAVRSNSGPSPASGPGSRPGAQGHGDDDAFEHGVGDDRGAHEPDDDGPEHEAGEHAGAAGGEAEHEDHGGDDD